MEGESSPVKSFETETRPPGGLLILLLMAALIDPGATSHNPHQPAKITWKLNDGQAHELLNETSGIHPPNTWWPDLNFDLSSLFAKQDGLYGREDDSRRSCNQAGPYEVFVDLHPEAETPRQTEEVNYAVLKQEDLRPAGTTRAMLLFPMTSSQTQQKSTSS